MSEAQKYFQTSTVLFYQNKLEQSLEAIDRSIDLKPTNSISYSNRALIKYHLGKVEQAKQDLSVSMALNPINYMAYFNLSSIYLRLDHFYPFIKNIECAISSLKLIVGRSQREKHHILASLEICNNNFDAFIILLLMEIQRQNFKEAQAIILKYGQFQTDQNFVNKISKKISLMASRYSIEYEQEFYQILQQQVKKQRLISSVKHSNNILEEQYQAIIRQKIGQFNKYYKLVNQSIGKVNHIPRNNEKYILMDKLTYPRAKPFNFFIQTQMIASH